MSEWVFAGLAALIVLVAALERRQYRQELEQHAKERRVIFINERPYRIVPEEQAINWELRDLYHKYGGKDI